MFLEFLRFELRYWFRGWMVYIFLAITSLIFFLLVTSSVITVGGPLGSSHRNAPYAVQTFYAASSLMFVLMTTAFVDSAASRDFAVNSTGLLFTKPIRRTAYLSGRFLGACIAALVPNLGVSLGIIAGSFMPWVAPERLGPTAWEAHIEAFLLFSVPNTFFLGSLIFTIAVLTRSTLTSFIGTGCILVGYSVASGAMGSLEREGLAALFDPLGNSAFDVLTKYWTVEEKNTLCVPITGYLLMNRMLWMACTAIVFAFACSVFSFSERSGRAHRTSAQPPGGIRPGFDPMSVVGTHTGLRAVINQLLSQTTAERRMIMCSVVFRVMLGLAVLNMIPIVWFNAGRLYDLPTFRVTYNQIDNIRGSLYIFLIAIITYFSGVLVWKERDFRMHEIFGALPTRSWTTYVAKFLAMMGVIAVVLLSGIVLSVAAQAAHGYTRFQFSLYVTEILVLDLMRMGFLVVIAMAAHTLAPNKYIGYFGFVFFLILNTFLWQQLGIESLLVKYGRLPRSVYSDLYGFAPYAPGLISFSVYWVIVAGLLSLLTIAIWQRGTQQPLRTRVRHATSSVRGRLSAGIVGLLLLWTAYGGWLYYNTQVLNRVVAPDAREKLLSDYEKTYSEVAAAAQPRVVKVDYEIDIYPEKRDIRLVGKQVLTNKSQVEIDKLYLTLDPDYQYDVDIPGATLESDDTRLSFRTYKLSQSLAPGASMPMNFTVKAESRGIENSVSHPQIVQNGTFFNNSIAPQIGFVRNAVIRDPQKRRKYKLPLEESLPEPSRECTDACMQQYVTNDADWVDVETVISTSSDQIAVAPGSLVEQWEKDGRKFFRYRLDHPSLNFYSFISARYAVERDEQDGINIEVYYHPEHTWNVPRMVKGMKHALAYCSQNFGPYRHKQARIIEFPRFATFAQAFPGTMPYSESIGFIADLEKPDDIDMVYYVTAHEMAHQWWAHQVIGARVQGATLLSETLAQYSALMIMEREYGRDMMRKFLRYEMDSYLRARGSEIIKERPLLTVNPDQGYIHYRKGSVALYYLKECIGEERINAALKELIERFAYHEPPYPNALHLVDALKKHTPPELHYVLTDLFESITLYSNRTLEASANKLEDGRYEVHLKVECRKVRADESGKESPLEFHEQIEIGAFKKPEKGKQYGETLYRQRVDVAAGSHDFTFVVDQEPATAGIDPFCLLIDRTPEDNSRTIEIAGNR
ncbi:MAG: M1 family aminopeptidase [Pirellulales bacterium]